MQVYVISDSLIVDCEKVIRLTRYLIDPSYLPRDYGYVHA